MGTTYLKRQKEMKRLEKQREKAERRAQKKLANRQQREFQTETSNPAEDEISSHSQTAPSEAAHQN
jgi:CHAD domain-containing protein